MGVRHLAGEDQEGVGGQGEGGGVGCAVEWGRGGGDHALVAGGVRVGEILVGIAVEDFAPATAAGEADAVVETVEVGEMDHDDHILALALDPALEGEHSLVVMGMEDMQSIAAEAGEVPTQLQEFTDEAQVIVHVAIAGIETGPMEQEVLVMVEVVGPLFILEELLAHEKHGDTGSGQAQAGGNTGSAASVPGPRVRGVGQAGDALLAGVAVVAKDEVVVLRTLDELPGFGESLGPEAMGEPGHVQGVIAGGTRVTDDSADGDAQAIGEGGVEAGAAGGGGLNDVGVDVPVFGEVQGVGAEVVEGVGQVLAEAPAVGCAVVVDHAHLVIAETVDSIFLQEEPGVLDEEVAHLGFAEIEHQTAGVTAVEEVEGVGIAAGGVLAVEEVEAFVAEAASGVVIDDVEEDGEAVDMAEIDEGLELVHFAAKTLEGIGRELFGLEQGVKGLGIRWEGGVFDGEVHFPGRSNRCRCSLC